MTSEDARAWKTWGHRDALTRAVGGDAHLAREIFSAMGPTALDWMDQSIPALGGKKPKNAVRSPAGQREIRKLLARFPR